MGLAAGDIHNLDLAVDLRRCRVAVGTGMDIAAGPAPPGDNSRHCLGWAWSMKCKDRMDLPWWCSVDEMKNK